MKLLGRHSRVQVFVGGAWTDIIGESSCALTINTATIQSRPRALAMLGVTAGRKSWSLTLGVKAITVQTLTKLVNMYSSDASFPLRIYSEFALSGSRIYDSTYMSGNVVVESLRLASTTSSKLQASLTFRGDGALTLSTVAPIVFTLDVSRLDRADYLG